MDYYEIILALTKNIVVKGHVFTGLDVNNNIFIYIDGLNALNEKRVHVDLTGRGISLEDASCNYIRMLLNPHYVLRSTKHSGYITNKIRIFVKTFTKIPYGLLESRGEI